MSKMRTLRNQQNIGLFEWLIGIILIVLFGALFASAANAQESFAVQCAATLDGYVATNLIARYESGDITLVTINGEPYRVLEHNTSLQSTLRYQWWSSNCHYFAAAIDEGEGYSLVVWDALEGRRVGTFEGLIGEPVMSLYWSPDGQHIVINSQIRSELWNLSDGSRVQLGIGTGSGDLNRDMVHWDMERGELWRLRHYNYSSSDAGVTVYNFAGETVAYYNNPAGADRETGFRLSDDGRYVIVYTVRSTGLRSAGVTVWQRGTHENVQIDADTDGVMSPYFISLSLDGRYLAIAHDTLRVWDLQNLSADFEQRDSINRYGIAQPISIHFLDNTTVQIDGRDGVVDTINIATGEFTQ
jgi:hypothetical protein